MAKRKAQVLKLVTTPVRANSDAIGMLERTLQEARAGEIESVAIAYVRADRTIGHCWSESYVGTLLGAISRLQWYLNKAADSA